MVFEGGAITSHILDVYLYLMYAVHGIGLRILTVVYDGFIMYLHAGAHAPERHVQLSRATEADK